MTNPRQIEVPFLALLCVSLWMAGCGGSPTVRTFNPQVPGSQGPSDLVATAAADALKVTLTWKDNSTFEKGFELERKLLVETDAGCANEPNASTSWEPIFKPAQDVTIFEDDGLTSATKYAYRIRAFAEGGEVSEWVESNLVTTVFISPPAAPDKPSDLTAVWKTVNERGIGVLVIQLKWTDNSSDETEFVLYRQGFVNGQPSGQLAIVGPKIEANETSFNDSSASRNRGYCYAISAKNGNGESEKSNLACVEENSLDPPTNLQGVPGVTSVQLNWEDRSDNEDHYYVQYMLPGTSIWYGSTNAKNTQQLNWTNLTANTTYIFKVSTCRNGAFFVCVPNANGEIQVKTLKPDA